jgi:hypothetical protein
MTDTKLPSARSDELEGPHGLVCQAYLNGEMHLGLKYLELNKRGSPAFRWPENVIPYLMIIAVVAQYTYDYGYIGFAASLLITGFLGFYFIPRFLAKRVRARALAMALADEAGWDKLWAAGGLGLRLAKDPNIGCDSPDCNWRDFAEKYLKE